MSLRSRLKRVEKVLVGEMDSVELVDGSKRYFTALDARQAVFLSEWAIGRAGYRGEETIGFSPLIRAVADATEESRKRFIERYRDPFTGPTIVEKQIPRARLQWATLDGEVRTLELVGEEALAYFKAKA